MGAIISAALGWFVKTILIKFVVFTILYLVVTAFISYLISKLTTFGPESMLSALSAWSPEMWFFADLTLFTTGFPAVISAFILRFSIRRIPLIG